MCMYVYICIYIYVHVYRCIFISYIALFKWQLTIQLIFFVEATEKSSTPVKGAGAEANPVTLPSFFPTKEELEAKLLAAKKQPPKVWNNLIDSQVTYTVY